LSLPPEWLSLPGMPARDPVLYPPTKSQLWRHPTRAQSLDHIEIHLALFLEFYIIILHLGKNVLYKIESDHQYKAFICMRWSCTVSTYEFMILWFRDRKMSTWHTHLFEVQPISRQQPVHDEQRLCVLLVKDEVRQV
jgi:hypothetical protein